LATVGSDRNLDGKEQDMRTTLCLMIGLTIVASVASAAQGKQPSPSPIQRIIAQEDANSLTVLRSRAQNRRAAAQFHGLTPAAYAALVAQGRALDARYGNAVTRLTPQQFTELYRDGGSKLTPRALNALAVRSEALNKLASTTTPALAPVVVTVGDGGFDWGDAGIGGAAVFALALVAAGGIVLVRDGRRQKAHG
jgi:hypothetical protein